MTIQEMKERKKELGLSNQELSRRTGISVSTLQRILSGKTASPRQDSVEALEKVLRRQKTYEELLSPETCVRETAAAYQFKKQGEYTLEDYYAIPDERRVELIDGVIYDMSAPSSLHQKILAELHLQFRACADAHGGKCDVYFAPCDVQLDNDNKTMLQPDLFVLCRDYDRTSRHIAGAPDFALEILSPSTRSKDMLLKPYKYQNAGVKEYWIVDPESKEVIVYDFSNDRFRPEIYPFDSIIPIHLSGGTCSVDFSKINERIAPHYA